MNNELRKKLRKIALANNAVERGLDDIEIMFERSSYFKNKDIVGFVENIKEQKPHYFKYVEYPEDHLKRLRDKELTPEQIKLYSENKEEFFKALHRAMWGNSVKYNKKMV